MHTLINISVSMCVCIIRSCVHNDTFNSNPTSWNPLQILSLAVRNSTCCPQYILFAQSEITYCTCICQPHCCFYYYHLQPTACPCPDWLGPLHRPLTLSHCCVLSRLSHCATPWCWKQDGRQDGKERAGCISSVCHRYYPKPCYIFLRIYFIFEVSPCVVA